MGWVVGQHCLFRRIYFYVSSINDERSVVLSVGATVITDQYHHWHSSRSPLSLSFTTVLTIPLTPLTRQHCHVTTVTMMTLSLFPLSRSPVFHSQSAEAVPRHCLCAIGRRSWSISTELGKFLISIFFSKSGFFPLKDSFDFQSVLNSISEKSCEKTQKWHEVFRFESALSTMHFSHVFSEIIFQTHQSGSFRDDSF